VLHATEDSPVFHNQKREQGDGSVKLCYVLRGKCDSDQLPNLPRFPLLFSMGWEWQFLLAPLQLGGITSPPAALVCSGDLKHWYLSQLLGERGTPNQHADKALEVFLAIVILDYYFFITGSACSPRNVLQWAVSCHGLRAASWHSWDRCCCWQRITGQQSHLEEKILRKIQNFWKLLKWQQSLQ